MSADQSWAGEVTGDDIARDIYERILDALNAEIGQSFTMFTDDPGLSKAVLIIERMRKRDTGQ